MSRYFEDFVVGEIIETRGITLNQAQITDFALLYDPQRFHLDEQAAAAGPFGRLIASGWQTMALSFRLFIDTGVIGDTGLGGRGASGMRWLRPVYPGDTLRVRVTVTQTTQSRRPDRGYVVMGYETLNQNGDCVMEMTVDHIVARRPAPADS